MIVTEVYIKWDGGGLHRLANRAPKVFQTQILWSNSKHSEYHSIIPKTQKPLMIVFLLISLFDIAFLLITIVSSSNPKLKSLYIGRKGHT